MLAYNALKELDDQVNNVLSAQQEAHGYLHTLQSLSDRQSALANKESSLAQLKQDNETLDAEIQALREQIAGMDPADENLPALSAALAEKEAAYNDNLLTIAQAEAEIAVEKSTLEADMAAAGVTAETLPERLTAAAEAAAAADAAVDGIDALLAAQGTDRAGLAASVAETKAQLDALDEGIAQLAQKLYARCGITGTVISKELGTGLIYEFSVKDPEQVQKMLNLFGHTGRETTLRIRPDCFKCQKCGSFFISTAFLCCGTATDPEKEYNIEFLSPRHSLSQQLEGILAQYEFNACISICTI